MSESQRRNVFNSLHNLSHPGIRASARLVSERYVWPSMQRDCRIWARSCLHCQRAKVTRHVTSPLGQFAQPSARFRHVHIDLIGPLPPVRAFRYCLTAIDRYTRWPEVWPIEDITAETVAKTFFTEWISRFGVPSYITTDQGTQFESRLFKSLGMCSGFHRSRTTSRHPICNGMIERFHRQLKAAIMCHPDSSWLDALPVVLLGIRSVFKPDIQATAAELVYGEPIRLPGEMITPPDTATTDVSEFIGRLRQSMAQLRPSPAAHHSQPKTFVFKDLATCTHAFLRDDAVRRPFQPPYTGPYRIVHRDGKVYTLQVKGKDVRVSIDRLKPAYIFIDDADAAIARSTLRCAKQSLTPTPSNQNLPITTRSGRQVRFPDFYKA